VELQHVAKANVSQPVTYLLTYSPLLHLHIITTCLPIKMQWDGVAGSVVVIKIQVI